MHLWKILDFSALLSKGLYTFMLVVSWLNYDLRVVFYVGFRNWCKRNPKSFFCLNFWGHLIHSNLSFYFCCWLLALLYAEPIHCSTKETSFVQRATHLQHIALNLHRAVIGLAVSRVVDRAT